MISIEHNTTSMQPNPHQNEETHPKPWNLLKIMWMRLLFINPHHPAWLGEEKLQLSQRDKSQADTRI